MRAPTRTALRGAVATTSAALALTLSPGLVPGAGAASGDQVRQTVRTDRADLPEGQVAVRLKVADQPPVEVAAEARVWPVRVLERRGVSVDGDDLVKVIREGRQVKGRKKLVRHGDTVKMVRVTKRRHVKRKKVRAGVVRVPTTKLKPGRRKVVRKARPGIQRVVARRTFHNGTPKRYKVLSRKTVRKARPRKVLVGRKAQFVPGTGGLNWGGLARCESGGNPRAVNPAGYYGLYQFNVGTWRSVGGSGMPHHASAGEQTYRAKLLYKSRGRSPWPHCGRYL